MEGLDLLKKDWNKDSNYPNLSVQEIYTMLRKKSSSTVKWIFIISILELSFGLFLNLILSITKTDEQSIRLLKNLGIYNFYQTIVILIYIVIIYFIVRFYLMFKKVSTTDNTKLLMKNILKTRKVVQNYILFNLVSAAIFTICMLSLVLKSSIENLMINNNQSIEEVHKGFYLLAILLIAVFTTVFTLIFWLIYRLIYGFLLKRLKVNYEELKRLEV